MYVKSHSDPQRCHERLRKLGYHRYYISRSGREQGFINIKCLKISEFGVFYVAFGDKYLSEARTSAESIKSCNPDINTFIITDNPDVWKDSAFDFHYPLNRLEKFELDYYIKQQDRWPSVKVLFLEKSIFQKTLFLDSDTYVKGDIGEIESLLNTYDLLLTNMPELVIDTSDPELERPRHKEIKSLTGAAFSCAVFAYTLSPNMQQFLSYWKLRFVEESMGANHKGNGNWGHTNGTNEQSILHLILKEGVLQKLSVKRGTLDNTIYNTGLSMWNLLYHKSKWQETKIIHSHAIRNCLMEKLPVESWPLHPLASKIATEN